MDKGPPTTCFWVFFVSTSVHVSNQELSLIGQVANGYRAKGKE